MSHDPADPRTGAADTAASLLARGAAADSGARTLRDASVRDLLLPDAARLDDRRRAALRTLIRAIVGVIGGDLHRIAAERLNDDPAAARALAAVEARQVLPLVERQLAADPEIAGALIDRVTLDLIGEALPEGLFESTPPVPPPLSSEALLVAENRRRSPPDQPPYAIDLPAEAQERFTWWVAAAIGHVAGPGDMAVAGALAWAAGQILMRHDEGDGLEAIASRTALSIAPRGDALAGAIDHCLKERRIVVLTALIAHAAGIPYPTMRAIVSAADDDRLWLVLRAIELPDAQLARLGFALSEADRRRDTDRFAEQFDAIRSIAADDARAVLAPLRLPPAMRRAIEAMA